jgi:hypothetical protein
VTQRVQSVTDLEARLAAERSGEPFVVYHDEAGRQQIVGLGQGVTGIAIGRDPVGGIRLDWDRQVSRIHAVLERVAGAWMVVDDGMSRNGTFVAGDRLHGRRRLQDGDVVLCGSVAITYRDPGGRGAQETLQAEEQPAALRLSPAQRRVLVALCRPLADSPHAPPATNKAIAAELTISVEAVKTHLRRLSETLGIEDLPQNRKRAELAWTALRSGVVSARDLRGPAR